MFEPDFGLKLNRVAGESDAETPLLTAPLAPLAPELSSNAAPPRAPTAAATAKTGLAGVINCPVINCGIWE